MKIIEGRDVDLISPFPAKELKRIFGWMRCYRTITETTAFPKTEEELAGRLGTMTNLQTYGIIDKNNFLGVKHEVPLIGIYMFDQDTVVNGNAHVASTRKAWGSRLVDQAGQLLIKHIFETMPTLTRVTVSVLHSNAPAKALAKRLGFRYEGCLRDAITVNDFPASMALFGLTRRDWDEYKLGEEIIEPVAIGKQEQELVHG
jgi:RimJ/RimL family protein N-acetyltransferase